jgi:hypothetical protein
MFVWFYVAFTIMHIGSFSEPSVFNKHETNSDFFLVYIHALVAFLFECVGFF